MARGAPERRNVAPATRRDKTFRRSRRYGGHADAPDDDATNGPHRMRLAPPYVTAASRRTLPAYPVFCAVVGSSWAFDPGSRISGSAALSYAGNWTQVFGWICVAIAVVLALALIVGSLDPRDRFHARRVYTLALGALVGWFAIMACILLAAAIFGGATWGAWAWPGLVAWLSWASMVSLEVGETTP